MSADHRQTPPMAARTQRAPVSSWTTGFIIYFVLPLCAFTATALYLNSRDHLGNQGTPPPPPVGNTLAVQGLTGLLAGEQGARLELRLLPLHADPDRQRFDQVQLRRHFELGAGEPWRLEVRYHADPGRPLAEQARLDLSQLRVVDGDGKALARIPAKAPTPVTGLRDPLAELLSRTPAELGAGHTAQLILWGPAPEDAALVQGLVRAGEVALPLFAPANPQSELALISAAMRQDRELALFQAENAPELSLEDQR